MTTILKQLCSYACELADLIAETPDALKVVISADAEIDAYSTYPYSNLCNSKDLNYFELQCRGEADNWTVEFHHPSKSPQTTCGVLQKKKGGEGGGGGGGGGIMRMH